MNPLKLRRTLITVHLWLAGLLAPAFLIVAISGGLYLADIEAKTRTTPLELPAGTEIAFGTPEMEGQIRAILEAQGVDVNVEYIRGRGDSAQTRPTTRRFVTFQNTPDGITAAVNEPNLQYILMELHKGHGPRAYRVYQIFVAISLFLVVIGGIIVGLLAKTYRRSTMLATAGGTCVALLLILL